MIKYFVEHKNEYDEFLMDGMFNQPQVFLDFYIKDSAIRTKATIGGIEQYDPKKRQLFGLRKEEYLKKKDQINLQIQSIVYYPNGDKAFYLVKIPSQRP